MSQGDNWINYQINGTSSKWSWVKEERGHSNWSSQMGGEFMKKTTLDRQRRRGGKMFLDRKAWKNGACWGAAG